jgi:hypothetical protein
MVGSIEGGYLDSIVRILQHLDSFRIPGMPKNRKDTVDSNVFFHCLELHQASTPTSVA